MHHGQHINLAFRGDGIHDDIRQPDYGKLAGSLYLSGATEQRERSKHHCRLNDTGNGPLGRPFVTFPDPFPDRDHIIPGLRREINVQARDRPKAARPGSCGIGRGSVPAHARSSPASTLNNPDRASCPPVVRVPRASPYHRT